MKGPRHSTISSDAAIAAEQNAENARDTREALAGKLSARFFTIDSYTAAGATTAKIPLLSGDSSPVAVLLVRAFTVSDPGAATTAASSLNFYFDARNRSLNVFEPAGLTAGVAYSLTFMILE
jgi:hypothetical protein